MKKGTPAVHTPNYVSWNRNWVTVRRHLPIILKPLVVAVLATVLWKVAVHGTVLTLSDDSENPVLFIVIMFSTFVYGILAGYAVTTVLGEYKEISKAVVKNDMETFLLYRDEQLPLMIHILIGTMSVFISIFTMIFPYRNATIGFLTVFTVVFMLTLVYVIIAELDDYYHSIWFKEKIPQEWYEVDITDYFKQKKQ